MSDSRDFKVEQIEDSIVTLWMHADSLDKTVSFLVIFSNMELQLDEDGELILLKTCYYEV